MKGNFMHVVYFWLKEPGNEEHRNRFTKSITKFVTSSNNIASVHVGTPPEAKRDVVDGSFTFSLIVTFDSKELHDAYQLEEAHLVFIEECSELWERVQVYDSTLID